MSRKDIQKIMDQCQRKDLKKHKNYLRTCGLGTEESLLIAVNGFKKTEHARTVAYSNCTVFFNLPQLKSTAKLRCSKTVVFKLVLANGEKEF